MTDKELTTLLKRACELFGDQVLERALMTASATAADAGAGENALRAAFAHELRQLLAVH